MAAVTPAKRQKVEELDIVDLMCEEAQQQQQHQQQQQQCPHGFEASNSPRSLKRRLVAAHRRHREGTAVYSDRDTRAGDKPHSLVCTNCGMPHSERDDCTFNSFALDHEDYDTPTSL